jgi:hypothetical protein
MMSNAIFIKRIYTYDEALYSFNSQSHKLKKLKRHLKKMI